MKKEIKPILKNTAKIACAACVATAAIAVMTSGVALKAIGEGGKYFVDAVKRIVADNTVSEDHGAVSSDAATTENII